MVPLLVPEPPSSFAAIGDHCDLKSFFSSPRAADHRQPAGDGQPHQQLSVPAPLRLDRHAADGVPAQPVLFGILVQIIGDTIAVRVAGALVAVAAAVSVRVAVRA